MIMHQGAGQKAILASIRIIFICILFIRQGLWVCLHMWFGLLHTGKYYVGNEGESVAIRNLVREYLRWG